MAYPPPPGIHNLPAKPPSSTSASASTSSAPGRSTGGGFKPAFTPSTAGPQQPPPSTSASSYSSGPQRYPGAPGASYGSSQYGSSSSYSSYPGNSGSTGGGMSRQSNSYSSYPQQSQQSQSSYGAQSYGPQSYGPQSYGAPPQIRNPFPMPGAQTANTASAASNGSGAGTGDYDPDMAAQIAQWQSAYMPREVARDKDGKPIPGTDSPKVDTPPVMPSANPNTGDPDHKKTVVRKGGGKKWTDDTLLDWDPSHLRLFVGNLAGETTDESLLKAFSRWKSVQMARVIREKRTNKSKGYGFVSFSDADDFFQAAKEMDGKYIQSHPVRISKAKTELKSTTVKEKDRYHKGKNNKGKASGSGGADYSRGGGGGANGYDAHLGPAHGAGVTKPGQKTKNGLRLLG